MEGGESMSLEAIKKVNETEQGAQARKAEAAANAKKLTADAEKAGRERLEAQRAKAESDAREAMARAEAKAAAHSEEALAAARKECEALRKSARGRLDQAAELIVRRVVNE